MKLSDACFASRFSQAGLYLKYGDFILAEMWSGGYIAYYRRKKDKISVKAYNPTREIVESIHWLPISPLP